MFKTEFHCRCLNTSQPVTIPQTSYGLDRFQMFQESGPGRFRTANSSDSREVRRGSKAKEPGVDQETMGPFSLWVSQPVVHM